MHKKLITILLILTLAMLACSTSDLPIGGGSDGGANNNNDSGLGAGSGSGGAEDAADAGGDNAGSQPDNSGSAGGVLGADAPAGPDTLALDTVSFVEGAAPNYQIDMSITYDGLDTAGNPAQAVISVNGLVQTQPVEAASFTMGDGSGEAFITVVVGGKTYSYFAEFGCTVFDSDDNEDIMADMTFTPDDEEISGNAQLIEAGVVVNGVMTDKYQMDASNFIDDSDDNLTVEEAYMYVAREGGYVVRMEMKGTESLDDFTNYGEIAPGSEASVSYLFNFTPLSDPPTIVPPPECGEQIEATSEYPMMDDASNVVSIAGSLYYETNHTLDEVLDFYRTELPLLGWELVNDTAVGSLAQLEFTKDGVTIFVMPIVSGDKVSVSIQSN